MSQCEFDGESGSKEAHQEAPEVQVWGGGDLFRVVVVEFVRTVQIWNIFWS